MLGLPDGLEKKLNRASSILEEYDKFRIITHYDGDGIASAAVLAQVLMDSKKGFHCRFVHSFPDDISEDLPVICTDIGNSHLDKISEMDCPAVVLDHHAVDGTVEGKEDKVFINPHEFGIDGSQEVSGGTLSFLLAYEFKKRYLDLAFYGLVGAAADKQNIEGFSGVNRKILDKALEEGELSEEGGLYIDGGGVMDALMKACDPYFPGLSGREENISEILDDLKIDHETPVDEVPKGKGRKLNSFLVMALLKRDIPSHVIENISGPRYRSPLRDMDIDLMYRYVNALARTSKPGLGLSLCLGEVEALESAREIRGQYREDLVSRLKELEDDGIEKKENIQYFYEEKRERKGELAGLGMLYMFDQNKAAFGLAQEDGSVDISARGTKRMVEAGLDLGALCREIADEFGGDGGGHDIAAGARVSSEDIDDFLERMDERVGLEDQSKKTK